MELRSGGRRTEAHREALHRLLDDPAWAPGPGKAAREPVRTRSLGLRQREDDAAPLIRRRSRRRP